MAGTIVSLSTAVTNRYVFELRYWFGHTYWDRCGKIINQILRDFDAWKFGDIGTGSCKILCEEQNQTFAFGPSKLDLSQSQDLKVVTLPPIADFANVADRFSEIVTSTIGVDSFSRIGFRCWYLYPTSSREDARERILSLKVMKGVRDFAADPETLSSPTLQFTVERATRQVRVAISTFEQQVELTPGIEQAARTRARDQPVRQQQILLEKLRARHMIASLPRCGVLVDLFAFIEDPPMGHGTSAGTFLVESAEEFGRMQAEILASSE